MYFNVFGKMRHIARMFLVFKNMDLIVLQNLKSPLIKMISILWHTVLVSSGYFP